MKNIKETKISAYDLHVSDGDEVVRNPVTRSLLKTKLQGVDPEFRNILAAPRFRMRGADEVIEWDSDQFSSEPKPLSSLPAEEQEFYRGELARASQQLERALANTDSATRNLLNEALSCRNDDAIMCGDGKIAITEWGMHPQNAAKPRSPLGYDISDEPEPPRPPKPEPPKPEPPKPEPPKPEPPKPEPPKPEPPKPEPPKPEPPKPEPPKPEPPKPEPPKPEPPKPEPPKPEPPKPEPPKPEPPKPPEPPAPPSLNPDHPDDRKNKWWKWLLWLLLAILALILANKLFKGCGKADDPMSDLPETPLDINPAEDVTWDEDSMRRVLNNRVILVLSQGGTVNEFIREFRTKYPDEKKYRLSAPDTVVPRLVLNLPKDEKAEFEASVASQFPKWEIVVLPETMFENDAVPSDPDMKDISCSWQFHITDAFDAWDVTKGDPNVVVAVIDDGFDLSHPEIKDKIVKPYNAVYHNSDIFPQESGHGQHTSGDAVAAADNGTGVAGLAPGCSLMPIQVGDRNGCMPTSAIIDGILYAVFNGADVISMSIGSGLNPEVSKLPIPIQKNIAANYGLEEEKVFNRIFRIVKDHNVVFVTSAGNNAALIELDPMKRSDDLIRVSAIQPDSAMTNFTSYGDLSDVSAPGWQIYNSMPGGKYAKMDGTSMAAPIVAGGVALLLSNDSTLTPDQCKTILQETGIPTSDPVGPIVNFARALGADPSDLGASGTVDPMCAEVGARYRALMDELEQLKREHPGCISEPDTLTIPEEPSVEDFTGVWKSTTSLWNMEDEPVVLYFRFNGTDRGIFTIVEPDGTRFETDMNIAIRGDRVDITTGYPTSAAGGKYVAWSFVLTPDRKRQAVGKGRSLDESGNMIDFSLVRIS